jgi:hypothetical protein
MLPMPIPVVMPIATAALAPGKKPAVISGALPQDLNTESRSMAFIMRLKDMKEDGILDNGPLVVAPHIDMIAGQILSSSGFESIAKLAKGNSQLLKAVILVDSGKGIEQAKEVISRVGGTEDMIIDIREMKPGDSLTDFISTRVSPKDGNKVPANNIGIGLMENNAGHVEMLRAEFSRNGANADNTASTLLASPEAMAPAAYANAVNALHAAAVKKSGFVLFGIGEADANMNKDIANLVKLARSILGSGFVRFVKNVAEEIKGWIDSINEVSVSA